MTIIIIIVIIIIIIITYDAKVDDNRYHDDDDNDYDKLYRHLPSKESLKELQRSVLRYDRISI